MAGLAMWALPAAAGAATTVYHPDAESRNFTTSTGNWTSDTESDGLCLPVLLCPIVTNEHVATGGTQGDGYLETSVISLLGVAGESRAVWSSPSFTYNGANGKTPTKLYLRVVRDSDLSALLSAVGNEADYSVEIVNDVSGVSTRVIDRASLRPTQGWTTSGRVRLDEEELDIGRTYHIRIISRFIYGAQVIPGGSVGYDEVSLTAKRDEGAGGGNGTSPGNNAIFDGRRLFIKLKCFGVKNAKGKCLTRATALKNKKGKRYTFPIQRVVNAKKGKVVRARVRFRFRRELERRSHIVLKSVLRTSRKDKSKTTKFKKLKLIDRSPD
jgi:hypothetical protein